MCLHNCLHTLATIEITLWSMNKISLHIYRSSLECTSMFSFSDNVPMIWKLLRCIIFQVTNRRHISHISADYVGLKYSQQLQVSDKLNLKL